MRSRWRATLRVADVGRKAARSRARTEKGPVRGPSFCGPATDATDSCMHRFAIAARQESRRILPLVHSIFAIPFHPFRLLTNTMGPRRHRKGSHDAAASSTDANADGVEISIPNDTLYRDLASHNSYFDSLVDMLPSKLYIAGNTGDEMYNPKYKRGQHKESKEARRARNKAARLRKFQSPETTLEKKARLSREEAAMDMDGDSSDDSDGSDNSEAEGGKAGKKRRVKKNAAKKQQSKKKAGAWADDSDGDDDGDDDEMKAEDRPKNNNKSESTDDGDDVPGEGGSRVEALRARLRAKIAERQSQRPGVALSPDAVSKRAARRAEKQRRVEAAKKRADKGGSTQVGKNDAKKYKLSGAELGGTVVNTGRGANGGGSREEDLAGVDFGGIAGLTKKATYLDNKSLAKSGGKKKSLDRLLADAEKKRDRLQELKAGTEEDKEKAMRIQWGDTLKEASGERVRDDPALIRKAMKRKAKKKAKSAKAWGSRVEQLKEAKDQRQKIRSHNLDQRKLGGTVAANLSKKRIVTEDDKDNEGKKEKRPRLGPHAGAGGKSRAGFEGKRQAFINEAKPGKGQKQ